MKFQSHRRLALFLLSSTLVMSEVDFAREVRPILINHCINRHGGIKAKAGLNFTTKLPFLAGLTWVKFQ